MMKKRRGIVSLFLFLVFLALGISSCASTVLLPATLNIVPPSADVSPEIAAFSGMWEGKLNGMVDTILVVEKINTETAEVIISMGEWMGFKPRYFYATAKVLHGPTIEWINKKGNKFVYKMNKDLKSISGFLEVKKTGGKFQIYMNRRKSK